MFSKIVALAIVATAAAVSVTVERSVQVQPSFEAFKAKFGRSYASDNEHAKRAAIYADNVAFMDAHNAKHAAGEVTFDLGVNEFSDLSHTSSRRFTSARRS